ncbi:hypothetical protein AQS8620_01195 [Aquimixticola soesokkakensis]|uniref:Uncharacterized protein n=1 Tax=Aquimixticola soesokkakensis TaxID=1519096 RepID=A0A1Y5SD14_9RHOB|nr:hypothetical protein [Aquimixticola soesokkakensis]SLN35146.1 hypothetical protein AQS8620_01195 [Aquimixticola soesokkakensis]
MTHARALILICLLPLAALAGTARQALAVEQSSSEAPQLEVLRPVVAPSQGRKPVAIDALTRRFATCAGRLSAQMDHEWITAPERADATREARGQMIALLQAVMPQGGGADVMALRIDAKVAHGRLLARTRFSSDPAQIRWAMQRAAAEIDACRALLLG